MKYLQWRQNSFLLESWLRFGSDGSLAIDE
jgi:hypothetical protein